MTLLLENGVLELRFTVDLDATIFTLRSTVSLIPNSWYTVITGYQNEFVYLQVDSEPDQMRSVFKELFNHQKDHYLYLGGKHDCIVWGHCPERPSDFDGCIKEV